MLYYNKGVKSKGGKKIWGSWILITTWTMREELRF